MTVVATIADLLDMKARYAGNRHFTAACSKQIADLNDPRESPGVTAALAMLEATIHRCSPLVRASVDAPAQPFGSPESWRVTVCVEGRSSRTLSPRFGAEAEALAFRDLANDAITRQT